MKVVWTGRGEMKDLVDGEKRYGYTKRHKTNRINSQTHTQPSHVVLDGEFTRFRRPPIGDCAFQVVCLGEPPLSGKRAGPKPG